MPHVQLSWSALWSSLQCQIAAKKAETLPCLCILPPPPCYPSQCTGSAQRAARSSASLDFKPPKNKSIDKKASRSWQLVLCSKHGWGRACGKHQSVGCFSLGVPSPQRKTTVIMWRLTLRIRSTSSDCVESETQTLLHLTQNTACKMPLQALFPWKWTLALASLGENESIRLSSVKQVFYPISLREKIRISLKSAHGIMRPWFDYSSRAL